MGSVGQFTGTVIKAFIRKDLILNSKTFNKHKDSCLEQSMSILLVRLNYNTGYFGLMAME